MLSPPTVNILLTLIGIALVLGHSGQNGLSKSKESLVNVDLIFCGSLQELHAKRLCELLAFLVADLSLVLQVALVADKYLHDVRTSVLSNLTQPVFNVLERLSVRNVINEYAPVSSLVVSGGNGFESVLALNGYLS